MLTTHTTATLAATALALTVLTGGLVVLGDTRPANATTTLDRPGCRYRVVRVKTRLNVRVTPAGRVVDKLYPGDRTWGSCKKFGKWRRIHGTDLGRRGFASTHHLKKTGRR
ncbi:hypothetical protein ACIBI7_24845 [Nonomuraea fuscirosea]|uniref:hypothetical protein n=1 Tax=Nonomuraea fuscirosea TaxID=1291556 RepID=UPI00378A7B84